MDHYEPHHGKFEMQVDAALLYAAKEVARSLLAVDSDIAPIVIGDADIPVSLFVSRRKDRVVPMHVFELDGEPFYLGFLPQPSE